MSSQAYQLYFQNTLDLAKTIVIKSDESINLINEWIRLNYGTTAVDLNQPRTWKYYLNITGEYHTTDTPMFVTSLDTLEQIPFSKESLRYHTETRKAYEFGSRYYYSLVAEYPEQEQLILGILYPADIEHAISAPMGAILSYPQRLVEPQEITLIRDLDQWVQRYIARWNVKSFITSDTLYPAAQHAILYLNLVPELFNLRLRRCRTAEVHSFHIRQYLASHGRLDRYMDYMTLKQQLWLYRNISYIEHHAGLKDTFNWLIEHLLTERYIPIAEFTIRHLGSFDSQYHNLYWLRKRPLNTAFNVPEKDNYTLEEVLAKEVSQAPGNLEYDQDFMAAINRAIFDSLSSVVQTKDLESSMFDYTNAVPQTLINTLLVEWGHLAYLGLYRVLIHFRDPRTDEMRSLYTDDAFKYLIYLTARSIGIELDYLPVYVALRFKRHPKPTVSELMSIVDRQIVRDEGIARWLVDHQPTKGRMSSRVSFFQYGYALYQAKLEEWYLVSRTEHMEKRAYVANMVCRLYGDRVFAYADSTIPITEWLTSKGLPHTAYTASEYQELISNLFNGSTGYNADPTKLIRNIQAALIATMTQLSSYSVQLLRSINDNPIVPLNWAAIRIGHLHATVEDLVYIEANGRVLDSRGMQQHRLQWPIEIYNLKFVNQNTQHADGKLYRSMTYRVLQVYQQTLEMVLSPLVITADYPALDPAVYSTSSFIGWEHYLALTEQQQAAIVDIYH